MGVETKFFHMFQVLAFGQIPNKGELIESYEKLKKIFIDPLCTESILETINSLKNNLFYQEFELQDDPQFLSALVKKIDDSLMVDKILENPAQIKYSDGEKEALEQQLPRVKLLLNLNNDLRKETRDFYELYSENFNKLKEILFSEKINYKNIKWFLKSDFSKLIPGSANSFQTSLKNVFRCLLNSVSPALTITNVNSLKTIAQRNACKKNPINHNMFFRRIPLKEKKLSTIVRIALKNNLKKYIPPKTSDENIEKILNQVSYSN